MPQLSPAQRAYIRKRTKIHEPDPSEMQGELNIVPLLDVMVNLIVILIMGSVAVTFLQINTDLPITKRGVGGKSEEDAGLKLQATVVDRGIIVTGSGGKLAPGCTTTTTGEVITVEKRGNAYNWEALTKCAQSIKKQFEDETEVTVTAEPTVRYQHLISAMDAMRETEKGAGDLFPDVLISAGVR